MHSFTPLWNLDHICKIHTEAPQKLSDTADGCMEAWSAVGHVSCRGGWIAGYGEPLRYIGGNVNRRGSIGVGSCGGFSDRGEGKL